MSKNVAGTRLRVLVFSSDAPRARSLVSCARSLGHTAEACAEVAAAKTRLQAGTCDALVIDLDPLGSSTLAIVRALASAAPAGRPFMLLGTTGQAECLDLLEWAAAGLDRLVPSACETSDWSRALDPTLPPGFDPQPLASLRELDAEVSRQGVRALLSDTPRKLEVIRGAIQRRDVGAARHAAHSLKGSASQLGALRVAGLCARLEAQLALDEFDAAATTLDEAAATWSAAEGRLAAEAEM